MRVSKSKVEKWAELIDEISNQLYEADNSINEAEKECQEITHLQSDIYHSFDSDDEMDSSEIQDTCDKIDRHSTDTIQAIGNAQYIFDDKENGINKKVSKLYNELADMLEPNIFQRVFNRIKNRFNIIKSYRISFKIVRK